MNNIAMSNACFFHLLKFCFKFMLINPSVGVWLGCCSSYASQLSLQWGNFPAICLRQCLCVFVCHNVSGRICEAAVGNSEINIPMHLLAATWNADTTLFKNYYKCPLMLARKEGILPPDVPTQIYCRNISICVTYAEVWLWYTLYSKILLIWLAWDWTGAKLPNIQIFRQYLYWR
jgi:hypothetical protein